MKRVKLILAAAIAIIWLFFLIVNRGCMPVSSQTAFSLRRGMSEYEVKEIMGEPHSVLRGDWYYTVMRGIVPYSDAFVVEFDESRKVSGTSF